MRERKRIYSDNLSVLTVIKADPILWAAMQAGDSIPAINWLNSVTTNFWIWENSLLPEVVKNVFIANPVAVNALVGTDREVLFLLCSSSLDCRVAATRNELISRLGGNIPLATALGAVMKRRATQFEKIIAVGAGLLANPAVAEYESPIDASVIVFDSL